MIQKRSITSDLWEQFLALPLGVVSVTNTQHRTLVRVKENGCKVVLLHGGACNSWLTSSLRPLTGICPACSVLCSPWFLDTPKAQPVPWKTHRLDPSGHRVVTVTVVSPGGPEGGWGLTASLPLERMLQGEREPGRGQRGGHSGQGSCMLTMLGDVKGV